MSSTPGPGGPVTVSHLVKRTGVAMAVSKELLEQQANVDRLYGRKPPTDEEKAERAERLVQWRDQTARASVALAKLSDPLARAVLDLHSPEGEYYVSCTGCDFIGGYDGDPTEYPCRTVALVAEHHGIEMPAAWMPKPACDPLDDVQDNHTWDDEALATCIVCGALSSAWGE